MRTGWGYSISFLLVVLTSCKFSAEKNQSEFYEDGKLKSVIGKKNGVLNGTSKEFYETGILKVQGSWVNGIKEGEFVVYDSNGRVKQKEIYTKGRRVGKSEVFFCGGSDLRGEVL